jgi:hypothetical protein
LSNLATGTRGPDLIAMTDPVSWELSLLRDDQND